MIKFPHAIADLRQFTLYDDEKLKRLWDAALATKDVLGAIAELGVYKGGTALLLSRARPDTELHLFDTFAGLPEDDKLGSHRQGEFSASEEDVRKLLDGTKAQFHVGVFPQTTEGLDHLTFSLVHIDADLGSSTIEALKWFWPRLMPGGILLIDDYSWMGCPGVKLAVDAFAKENNLAIDCGSNHLARIKKEFVVAPVIPGDLSFSFRHGFGDCAHIALVLQLYKKRGWNVSVDYEDNKHALFKAAGIDRTKTQVNHNWTYHGHFNSPSDHEGRGNKVYDNLNVSPLPYIGDPDELWSEILKIQSSDFSKSVIGDTAKEQVDYFVRELAHPLLIFCPEGSGWKNRKDISKEATKETINGLLDSFPGTVILADWDNRVSFDYHGRVRHIRRDLGHIDIEVMFALLERSDLVISVDTGPIHYTAFTNCPTLGVMHDLHPTCITIPRQSAAYLCRHHGVNSRRRSVWNLIDSNHSVPTPDEIVKHAIRMVQGPAYGCTIGRDVMLQHLVLDKMAGYTPLSSRADRSFTFDKMLKEINKRFQKPLIVETGSMQNEDWPGAGCSTLVFSLFADDRNATFLSVDNNPEVADIAGNATTKMKGTSVILSDSVDWLKQNKDTIDVLYLDSANQDGVAEEQRCLAEFEAAESKLSSNAIVVIDDTVWNEKGWRGLGRLLVPKILRGDWKMLACGYQCVLIRK